MADFEKVGGARPLHYWGANMSVDFEDYDMIGHNLLRVGWRNRLTGVECTKGVRGEAGTSSRAVRFSDGGFLISNEPVDAALYGNNARSVSLWLKISEPPAADATVRIVCDTHMVVCGLTRLSILCGWC